MPLKTHVKNHPFISGALFLSLLIIFILFIQGLWLHLFDSKSFQGRYALYGGLLGFAATSLGALPALMLKKIPQTLEDSMLGFAAGMMLAAASFSLILPGIEAGYEYTQSQFGGSLLVVLGMAIGVILMLGLDVFVPHQHEAAGTFGIAAERYSKAWLFVFAIALHNLPEGMAIGVSFAQGDLSVGIPLTTAIVIQDIPEGLAVALTLRAVGFKAPFAVFIAVISGIFEPIGAILGVGLAGGYLLSYPIGLGIAAGAMIFVVSHEVIPETHRNGHQTLATMGLMAGFALMMVLDTALG